MANDDEDFTDEPPRRRRRRRDDDDESEGDEPRQRRDDEEDEDHPAPLPADDEEEERPRRRKKRRRRRRSIIKPDEPSYGNPLAVGWLDGLFGDNFVAMLIVALFCCEIALPLAIVAAITANERGVRSNALVVIGVCVVRFILSACAIGIINSR